MTNQIIEKVVKNEIKSHIDPFRKEMKSELAGVKTDLKSVKSDVFDIRYDLNNLKKEVNTRFDRLENKIDKLTDAVADFAGNVKKFDEEQTVLSSYMVDRTDRIENLEIKVFGQVAVA